jgi:hypothetical protein
LAPPVATLLARLRAHPELDREAVLAVFGQEGLSGGIGDGGHAFGPGQMNDAGGVLTGKLRGLSPEQKNAWAWSEPGIDALLAGVSKVAGGEHGPQAVRDIVSHYERPQDPGGEISRALSSLGRSPASNLGGGAAPALPSVAGGSSAADPNLRRQAILQLIQSIGSKGDMTPLVQAIQAFKQSGTESPAGISATATVAPTSAAPHGGGIAELLQEGTGGPTHSTGPHVHAAFNDPNLELAAITWAQQHGLSIRENPYVGDPVDPVHAEHSFHKLLFPGDYNGRKLGRAIDVSGPAMKAFYTYLAGQR